MNYACFARLFVASLPGSWGWPQSTGLNDYTDDAAWEEYGRKLARRAIGTAVVFPEHLAKAARLCGVEVTA